MVAERYSQTPCAKSRFNRTNQFSFKGELRGVEGRIQQQLVDEQVTVHRKPPLLALEEAHPHPRKDTGKRERIQYKDKGAEGMA